MLGRVFAIGLLGVVPILGSGCPCCSSAADEAKTVKRAALGAETRVPTRDEVKTYQLTRLASKAHGQYISAVDKGDPAAEAGLKAGDVLLALDANKVFSRDDIEDFLRVSQPGVKVKVLVKRAGTFKEETVTVTLGETKAAAENKQVTWQYAGLGQLDAALAAAKKDRKLVLVGLSGADT
jgi:predicted metalloprotease with PDZ domain